MVKSIVNNIYAQKQQSVMNSRKPDGLSINKPVQMKLQVLQDSSVEKGIKLYHGTDEASADIIKEVAAIRTTGNSTMQLGEGFYVTVLKDTATKYASSSSKYINMDNMIKGENATDRIKVATTRGVATLGGVGGIYTMGKAGAWTGAKIGSLGGTVGAIIGGGVGLVLGVGIGAKIGSSIFDKIIRKKANNWANKKYPTKFEGKNVEYCVVGKMNGQRADKLKTGESLTPPAFAEIVNRNIEDTDEAIKIADKHKDSKGDSLRMLKSTIKLDENNDFIETEKDGKWEPQHKLTAQGVLKIKYDPIDEE